MEEIVIYRALYDYRPSDDDVKEGYLPIQADDILEVTPQSPEESPTDDSPKGWMEGCNQRTGKTGFFPGTYVEFVERVPGVVAPPVPDRPVPRPRTLTKSVARTNVIVEPDDSGYASPMGESSSR